MNLKLFSLTKLLMIPLESSSKALITMQWFEIDKKLCNKMSGHRHLSVKSCWSFYTVISHRCFHAFHLYSEIYSPFEQITSKRNRIFAFIFLELNVFDNSRVYLKLLKLCTSGNMKQRRFHCKTQIKLAPSAERSNIIQASPAKLRKFQLFRFNSGCAIF